MLAKHGGKTNMGRFEEGKKTEINLIKLTISKILKSEQTKPNRQTNRNVWYLTVVLSCHDDRSILLLAFQKMRQPKFNEIRWLTLPS